MIYLSKPIGSAPRYIAQQVHPRRFIWWTSPTGKVCDLREIDARRVPFRVRRQIIKQRHRTTKHGRTS